MSIYLVAREHRPQLRLSGGIADARGVIANYQDHGLPGVLKLAQLLEHYDVPEMDVRGRRVDAELHPQRAPLGPSALELALEVAFGKRVDRIAGEERGGLGGASGHRANAKLSPSLRADACRLFAPLQLIE